MEKTARTGAAGRVHICDEDCTVNPETDTCRECGTTHGDPCSECGARAFHRASCDHAIAVAGHGGFAAAPSLNEVHPIPMCFNCGAMILGDHQCAHTADVADVLRDESRFTAGLLFDVYAVLERHGYHGHPDSRSMAQAMVRCLQLVKAYEGGEL